MTQPANYGTSGLDPKMPRQQAQAPADAWGGFEERPDPKKIELGDGELFTGILTAVERVMVGNPAKPAVRYSFIELESNTSSFMIGTYQIDSKLRPTDVGHLVMIRYEGEDSTVGRNGNHLKKFGIKVSKRTAPGWASDGTRITDEDIPAEAFFSN